MDLDDVRVVQASDRPRFRREAGKLARVGVLPCQNHLEGDMALQADLQRLIDDTHSTRGDFTVAP